SRAEVAVSAHRSSPSSVVDTDFVSAWMLKARWGQTTRRLQARRGACRRLARDAGAVPACSPRPGPFAGHVRAGPVPRPRGRAHGDGRTTTECPKYRTNISVGGSVPWACGPYWD